MGKKFREDVLVEFSSVNYDITTLRTIVLEICELHEEFSEINRVVNDMNLRKKQVRNIISEVENEVDNSKKHIIENDFFLTIKKYIDALNMLTIELDMEYTYSDLDFRIRVKQMESIIYKLIHYRVEKKEKGSIAINKCLNDLLGFRVVLPKFKHNCKVFLKLCQEIEDLYKIRYRNASKGKYKATHVYFYGKTNKFFPWELQIWEPNDFETNHKSHAVHKQDYIKSAKIHKEAL